MLTGADSAPMIHLNTNETSEKMKSLYEITINAMRDLYEAGETDPETLLCALDEVLRVNDALTAKVEHYKRDAERWAWYRLGFVDPEQLDKNVDDSMRSESINQQQAEGE